MAKKSNVEFQAGIDRIANLVPNGQLAASMGAVFFLDAVANHLVATEARIKRLRNFLLDQMDVCNYGDGCPAEARHGRCFHCQAAAVLAAAPPVEPTSCNAECFGAGRCRLPAGHVGTCGVAPLDVIGEGEPIPAAVATPTQVVVSIRDDGAKQNLARAERIVSALANRPADPASPKETAK